MPCSSQHAAVILFRSAFLQLTLLMREKLLLLVCVKNVHCGTSLGNSLIAPKKGEMCGVRYCIKIYWAQYTGRLTQYR
jgi:hypothetical protein